MVERRALDYGTFGPELGLLFKTIENKLRNQWPVRLRSEGALFVLQGHVVVSHTTYRTIVHLCSDNPLQDGRRAEYAIAAPPLIRTILDAVFNFVYIFQDLTPRLDRFYKGGWREIREEHDRLRDAYGKDPDWQEWLRDFTAYVESGPQLFGITNEEVAELKRLPYWPTPAQMLRDSSLDDSRRAFLRYLNDWFYRELSSDSHLSLPGLSRRAVPLLGSAVPMDDYRSDCVFTAATLSTALLSETQITMRWPDVGPRLEYVWTMLGEHWPAAKEVHERRYKGRV
jgi:hypothetical protein